MLIAFTQAGDHILVSDSVYQPTRRVSGRLLARFGVSVSYYDPRIGAGIAGLITDKTRLVFAELPGSQSFEMQDIPAMAAACRARGVWLAADNTWATPLYCKPLALGADVSTHGGNEIHHRPCRRDAWPHHRDRTRRPVHCPRA